MVNFKEEAMSKTLLDYLQREHARLDSEVRALSGRRFPDEVQVARLKRLKLAVKDQITQLARDYDANVAA